MRTLKLFLALLFSASAINSIAAPYDHIHLTATNVDEAVAWYVKHFGGEAGRFRRSADINLPIDRVYYGDVAVIFFNREPTGGSVGTGVDHISFSQTNVEETIANIVADGGSQIGNIIEFAGMQLGFVEDPWGTKIEIIDDPELRGTHHLHLSSPDPQGTLQWYADNLGGRMETFGGALPGLHYDSIWLFVSQSQSELEPTEGRAMDHLGWAFPDLSAAADTLKSNGVEFTMEPRDFRGIRISFIEGPDGVRIELVQP